MAWQTLTHPAALTAISSGLGGLYRLLDPNDTEQIQDETLRDMNRNRELAQQHARGEFSPAEAQRLRVAAQPQLQAVAGSVASRGLGSSPAGAAITAEAEQQVFNDAQLRAQQMERVVNLDVFQATQQLAGMDASFFEDLRATMQNLSFLRAQGVEPDPELVSGLKSLLGMDEGYATVTYETPESLGESGFSFR